GLPHRRCPRTCQRCRRRLRPRAGRGGPTRSSRIRRGTHGGRHGVGRDLLRRAGNGGDAHMAPRVTLSVRTVATLLGAGFAVYFFARGFWWVEKPEQPALLVGGLVLYLVAVLAMMLTPDDAGGRMPAAIAVFG